MICLRSDCPRSNTTATSCDYEAVENYVVGPISRNIRETPRLLRVVIHVTSIRQRIIFKPSSHGIGLVVWQWKHIAKTSATVNDSFAGHFRLRPCCMSGEVDFGFNLSRTYGSDMRTGGGEAGVDNAKGTVVVGPGNGVGASA